VNPVYTVSLTQILQFGSASVQYSRYVSVAGGFGGTTDTQTVSGRLVISEWQRGLLIVFTPAYSTAESVGSSQQSRQVDVKALTLNLGVTYQIARYTSIFGGYSFLRQRVGAGTTTNGSSSSGQFDADQNSVKFGVQFGYPFNFD